MGTLEIATRSTSPYTYDKEYCRRDADMDLIRVASHLIRWFISIDENGKEDTHFQQTKEPAEVEGIKWALRQNQSPYWHVITAIKLQDGTIVPVDMTEAKATIMANIEKSKSNLAYALDMLERVRMPYEERLAEKWKFEAELCRDDIDRYVAIFNRLNK